MKKMKKALIIILTVCLCIVYFEPIAIYADETQAVMQAEEESIWDGVTTEAVFSITGNYEIDSAPKLAWFAQQVNSGNSFNGKTVLITGNINLNNKYWKPIGEWTGASNIAGTIKIENCTIKGLNTSNKYSGLFGNIKVQQFIIDNLKMENSWSCNSDWSCCVGTLIGRVEVAANGSLSILNSYFSGSTSNHHSFTGPTGGIIGTLALGDSSTVTVKNIETHFQTNAGAQIGSLFAEVTDSAKTGQIYISKVNTNDALNGNTSYGYNNTYVGGLIGSLNVGSIYIDRVAINGKISSSAYFGYAGGLIGSANYKVLQVENVAIKSEIYSAWNGVYGYVENAGGFLGYSGTTNPENSYIKNSYVVGKINDGVAFCSHCQSSSNIVRIENCYFDKNTTTIPANKLMCTGYADLFGINDSNSKALSTDAMKQKESYVGWDFDHVWGISENKYPALRWLSDTENKPVEPNTIIYFDGDDRKKLPFDYSIDSCLDQPSTIYNPDLAYMLIALANSAYQKEDAPFTLLKNSQSGFFPDNALAITESLRNLGFQAENGDVREFHYYSSAEDDNYGDDVTAYTLAVKTMSDGTKLVSIVIRGSYGSILKFTSDWKSNANFKNWGTGLHEGFNTAAEDIISSLIDFENDKISAEDKVKYVVTGHSRGAATANLVAKKLIDNGISKENVYDYNFACPDSARDYSDNWNLDNTYDNIYNINNIRDIVGVIPGNIFNGWLNAINLWSDDVSVDEFVFWGKYGHTYFFAEDWNTVKDTSLGGFDQHEAKLYLNHMSQKPTTDMYRSWEEARLTFAANVVLDPFMINGKLFGIFCPVDFEILDGNGVKLAEVVSGQAQYYNGSYGDIVIITAGDQSLVYINGSKEYYVKMIGNDSGEMTYCVSDALLDNEHGTEIKFTSVPLSPGKTMVSKLSNTSKAETTTLVLLDEGLNLKTQIDSNGNEKELDNSIKEEYAVLPIETTAEQYQITYNLNGGQVNGNPATYTKNTGTFTLNNPSRSGYTFTGWTGSNGSTPEKTVTITTGSIGNLSYYANWKSNNNGGSGPIYGGGTSSSGTTNSDVNDASNSDKEETVKEETVKEETELVQESGSPLATVYKKGTLLTDSKTKIIYKVTKSSTTGGTVQFVKTDNTKAKTLTIPATVTFDGITYKVTSIAANALKNNRRVTTVKIGKYVTSIGSGAFIGCTKLKKVTIGKRVTTIGSKAFYKSTSLTDITLPSKVTKIGNYAFKGCSKLNSIKISTKLLTSKTVSAKAFSGISTKTVIKVPKEKLKTYPKFLVDNGLNKKNTVK